MKNIIAKTIKAYRKKLGITQSELAERMGINKATVAMRETDKRNPTIYTLKKLAKIFGCTTDELLEFSDYSGKINVYQISAKIKELKKQVIELEQLVSKMGNERTDENE